MKYKLLAVSLVAFVLAVSGCAHLQPASSADACCSPTDWMQVYTNAVMDASNATPAKVATHLTAISRYNPSLAWRTNAGGIAEIKVVSFMSSATAAKYYKPGPQALSYGEQWVTVYPELKNFCASYHGADVPLRLKQLLGIPATAQNDTVVEIWVNPDYLFRPTPEPAINSVSAGLSTSTNAPMISPNFRTPAFWPAWYNLNLATRYDFSKGIGAAYPYTQLGYTYDWGSCNSNHVGLSEFMIPSQILATLTSNAVPIEVEAIYPAEHYGK